MVRSPAAIQADLAAALAKVAEIERERDESRVARHEGIVADFDAHLSREAIAAKWGVDYSYVANVLHKAGRSERTRRAAGLTSRQRGHYAVALRAGTSSALARRIAEAVSP